jgi:hypothetical protein
MCDNQTHRRGDYLAAPDSWVSKKSSKFVEKLKEALSAEAKQALSAEARMSGKRKQKKLVEKLPEKYLENLKVKELVDDLETLCNHESLDARHAPKVDSPLCQYR